MTLDERISIFARDNFRCIYCGKSQFEEGVKLDIGTLMVESGEGKSVFGNLITVCFECKEETMQKPGGHAA